MREFKKQELVVRVYETRTLMGEGAATIVADAITELMKKKDNINIVFAAAPSQNEFLEALAQTSIRWDHINAFHMDEYVGLDASAPQLFGNFLKKRIFGKVNFKSVNYISGNTGDPEKEAIRYGGLLQKYPADIVILGIGENTHLAFNDPHVADFNDPRVVKVVDLDEKNRHQQVDPDDEACFTALDKVPTHAITLTIPTLFNIPLAFAIVPGKNKAVAIYHTLNDDIQEKYPSTILRSHHNALLFIDEDSASMI